MNTSFLKAAVAGIILIVSAMSNTANAGLIDRGNGMIYDNVLDITWLQDSNYANTAMNWGDSTAWAESLVFGGFDDWRLSKVYDINADGCIYSAVVGTDCGYNVLTSYTNPASGDVFFSELAYMFYENLANVAYHGTDGSGGQFGWDTLNTSFVDVESGATVSFIDLSRTVYWSGTEYAPDTNNTWYLDFYNGSQNNFSKSYYGFAWAVRDGDVSAPIASVPEPSTFVLLGLALFGLVLSKRQYS